MRVQPRAGIICVVWWVTGTDYDTVGDTTGNVARGIVLPVGLGAVFLAASASHLGLVAAAPS